MLKRTSLFLLLLLSLTLGFAQGVSRYEYWIDADYAGHTTVNSTATDIPLNIDISRQQEGVHYLSFRARNANGEWGALSRMLFFIPEANTTATMRYQYWLDSDYDTRTTVNAAGQQAAITMSLQNISPGVHYLNLRPQNALGSWGSLSRWLFFVPDMVSTAAMSYQYWVDDDYTSQQVVTTSGEAATLKLDLSQMEPGVHYLNLRPQNAGGLWGALSRWLFFVPDMSKATPTHLEYWIDNDSVHQLKPLRGDTFTGFVDISQLTEGIHFFNYRGRDSEGRWGNIYRRLIYVTGETPKGAAPITGYRYNFNSESHYVSLKPTAEYELKSFVLTIPELSQIGSLTEGCKYDFTSTAGQVSLHRTASVGFAMQFQNQANEWSAPASTQFEMKDSCTKPLYTLAPDQELAVGKVLPGEFQGVKIDIAQSGVYYLYAEQQASLQIYNSDGSRYGLITPEQWQEKTHQIVLSRGTYYGVLMGMSQTDMEQPLKVRLMTNDNILPTPTISFADGMVTISCQVADANIYYTLDGTEPTEQSNRYSSAFELKHNATIKAKAVRTGWSDSKSVALTVDSYKVGTPAIEGKTTRRDGTLVYQLEMACQPAEAIIYYTLDGSDPRSVGREYNPQQPVTINGPTTVKAVGRLNGYNDSEVAEEFFDPSQFKTSAPVIARQGTAISISCQSEGADFYYTTDGTMPTAQSAKAKGALIQPERNYTYRVVAILEGSLPSDVATITVDWLQTPRPRLLLTGDNQLQMDCDLADATIYYALGGNDPTTASPSVRPGATITLTDNRVVKAMAVAPNLNVSDVATYTPGGFTAEKVESAYDGRTLTLTCATPGAVIHYRLSGGMTGEGVYTQPITIDQPCQVTVYAEKTDWNNSEQTTINLHSCYNGQVACTDAAGALSQAFQWSGTDNIQTLAVVGTLNATDLTVLRSMPALKHLDLSAATIDGSQALPDGAFAGMPQLLSISLPQRLSSVGTGIFSGCQQLAAITWNASIRLSETALSGFSNPNLLLYVRTTTDAPSSVRNVVANGVATSITLTDAEGNANFYCPTAFTAQHISYQHQYTMPTVVNQCRGWETIALPFTVQRVSHPVNGVAAPFAKGDASAKPFWLCRLTETGFVPTATIEAYQPYIISMPNNSYYADAYMLGGTITFEADNALIEPQPATAYPQKGEFLFVPSLTATPKASYVLPINRNEAFSGFPEGSNFFRDLERDVRPFEAYILSAAKASRFAIIDDEHDAATAITDLMPSPTARHRVYNLQGRLLMVTDDPSPAALRQRLGTGLYIVDSKKLYVK